jgi:hypothetical protein
MQNDPGSSHMFLRPVTISDDRFQANTVIGSGERTDGLRHGHLMPRFTADVNPMNASMHYCIDPNKAISVVWKN